MLTCLDPYFAMRVWVQNPALDVLGVSGDSGSSWNCANGGGGRFRYVINILKTAPIPNEIGLCGVDIGVGGL